MTKSYSLKSFLKAFGIPEFRQYPTHVACVCIDEDGEATYINPGRTGCDVDTSSPSAMKADMMKKKDDLRVLVGENATTGDTVYTLVNAVDGNWEDPITSTASDWGL